MKEPITRHVSLLLLPGGSISVSLQSGTLLNLESTTDTASVVKEDRVLYNEDNGNQTWPPPAEPYTPQRKLSPDQIGRIADIVGRAIHDHPNLPSPEGENAENQETPEGWMEPWEEQVKKQIDFDPTLPSYVEIQKNEDCVLDFLVNYYS